MTIFLLLGEDEKRWIHIYPKDISWKVKCKEPFQGFETGRTELFNSYTMHFCLIK